MTFLGAVRNLGLLVLVAMGGLIVLASLVVLVGMVFPALVAPLFT